MPTVRPGSKILVSGVNGYIGIWVARYLLEKGYLVRGTVRSDSKGRFLEEMFASYGDKFECMIVEDITADGAFDEAVKGVEGIEHIASPVFSGKVEKDHQEVIDAAVKGTVGILKSALKHGSSIKRIVLTSSGGAVRETLPEPKVFDENDWNEQSIQSVEKLGKDSPFKYYASKTLAEKAAWNFQQEHKSEVSWELVTLCPTYSFGPVIHEVSTVNSLNASVAFWYRSVIDTTLTDEELAARNWTWIDVRDVAEAHILGLETDAAGGQRFLLSAGEFGWQEWLDIAHGLPSSTISARISKGKPGASTGRPFTIRFDNSKASRILGLTYRDMAETTKDMLEYFESRGW
ncbi:hypothetical protein C8J56DRAFT_917374 [Mycena floridula]|nr:hypothetical protein C8J56DRAFT_917374 [Mycena floridula]